MQLSRHDLLQLDAACLAGLEEAPLGALWVQLLRELKEAHERLAKNPSNRFPPQSVARPGSCRCRLPLQGSHCRKTVRQRTWPGATPRTVACRDPDLTNRVHSVPAEFEN